MFADETHGADFEFVVSWKNVQENSFGGFIADSHDTGLTVHIYDLQNRLTIEVNSVSLGEKAENKDRCAG
jgi:hypothetical protein